MDKACTEECPVDCIYTGERKLYIQPRECIDCGACEPVCPVDAIYPDRQLPAEHAEDKEDNKAFFEIVLPGRDAPLGAPGGSMRVGNTEADTPRIAALPPNPDVD
jgi:NAD-dependent dihydropyrimidine dehydrogenase PreA subunit